MSDEQQENKGTESQCSPSSDKQSVVSLGQNDKDNNSANSSDATSEPQATVASKDVVQQSDQNTNEQPGQATESTDSNPTLTDLNAIPSLRDCTGDSGLLSAEGGGVDWLGGYQNIVSRPAINNTRLLSLDIRSNLIYVVLESELKMRNKRRIIHLSNTDLLYSSMTGKCVCLPIDWDNDFANRIKVNEGKHTWETTFMELAQTRENALSALFAHSQVWAEGNYAALA